ncbi:hypothetical protein PF008_g20080, partial [Phytophthora fragariae]
ASRLVAAPALERGELRLASSKRRPSSSTAVAQQAASRLVAASELAHGMLRLPGSKRRPAAWWRRPSSSMASCGWPAPIGVVHA